MLSGLCPGLYQSTKRPVSPCSGTKNEPPNGSSAERVEPRKQLNPSLTPESEVFYMLQALKLKPQNPEIRPKKASIFQSSPSPNLP